VGQWASGADPEGGRQALALADLGHVIDDLRTTNAQPGSARRPILRYLRV
jgi:hypothetical protein